MKILVINPKCRELAPPAVFPVGLGIVVAIMKKEGHNVKVVDADGLRLQDSQVKEEIRKSHYDLLAVGGLITVFDYIQKVCLWAKSIHPDRKVIVGGSVATPIPKLILQNLEADVLVVGEAELTLPELLKTLECEGDLSKINGIVIKKEGQIVRTPSRERLTDFSQIPFPAWDLFAFDNYARHGFHIADSYKLRSMNVSAVRGCPFSCSYCYKIFGRKVIKRPINNLVDEIEILHKEWNIGYVGILDDLFTIDKSYVFEFCDELVRRKLKIKWSTSARCDMIEKDMLLRMRDTGCVYLGYGIESGSKRVLDYLQRTTTPEQALFALRITREAGIRVHGSFMVGAPNEMEEVVMLSSKLAREAGIFLQLGFITPFPGTPLYEEAKNRGLIKNEIEYIKSLSDTTNLILNISSHTDAELKRLKHKAEKAANRIYVLKKMFQIPDIAMRHYKMWGFRSLIKEFFKLLR